MFEHTIVSKSHYYSYFSFNALSRCLKSVAASPAVALSLCMEFRICYSSWITVVNAVYVKVVDNKKFEFLKSNGTKNIILTFQNKL